MNLPAGSHERRPGSDPTWNRPTIAERFPWVRWIAWLAQLALGIFFIFSGMVKVLDARSFMEALQLYNLPGWLIPLGAFVPPVEVAVGLALVLGFVPRITTVFTLGMLLFFSILLLIGIFGGELDSCGCFGRLLEQSPGGALIRNGVLMVITIGIWIYRREQITVWRGWQLGLLTVVLLVLGTLTGYTVHRPQRDSSLARVGEFFPSEGFVDHDIELGATQLAFIFTVNCEHCWNSIGNAKALAADGGFPLFGVTSSAPHEIVWFQEEFEVNFPIYRYDPDLFGEAFRTWPALYYLQDGLILGRVEDGVPAPRTLMDIHLVEWQ